jgi:hypothetical protein
MIGDQSFMLLFPFPRHGQERGGGSKEIFSLGPVLPCNLAQLTGLKRPNAKIVHILPLTGCEDESTAKWPTCTTVWGQTFLDSFFLLRWLGVTRAMLDRLGACRRLLTVRNMTGVSAERQ